MSDGFVLLALFVGIHCLFEFLNGRLREIALVLFQVNHLGIASGHASLCRVLLCVLARLQGDLNYGRRRNQRIYNRLLIHRIVSLILDHDVIGVALQAIEAKPSLTVGICIVDARKMELQLDENRMIWEVTPVNSQLSNNLSKLVLREKRGSAGENENEK